MNDFHSIYEIWAEITDASKSIPFWYRILIAWVLETIPADEGGGGLKKIYILSMKLLHYFQLLLEFNKNKDTPGLQKVFHILSGVNQSKWAQKS